MKLNVLKPLLSIAVALSLVSCATRLPSARRNELNRRLTALRSYTHGGNRASAVGLSDFVTACREPGQRIAMEKILVTYAADPAVSRAGRQQVIRELGRAGSAVSAPLLIGLLDDPQLADDAGMALARITDPNLLPALRSAMATVISVKTKARLAVVLGHKRDTLSVAPIAALLTEAGAAAQAAAVLGELATSAAARALCAALPTLDGQAQVDAMSALVTCQAAAWTRSDAATAARVLKALIDAKAPAHVLTAARAAAPGDAARLAVQMMASQEPSQQAAGAYLARHQADHAGLLGLVEALPKLPATSQIAALGILGDRVTIEGSEAISRLVRAEEPAVQRAAMRALAHAGTSSSVAVLLNAAAMGPEENRGVARDALRLISCRGDSDGFIELAATNVANAIRVEVMNAVGDRGMTAAVPLLFAASRESDAGIRETAIRQLGNLAGPDDWMEILMLFDKAIDDKERQTLITAAAAAGRRVRNPGMAVSSRIVASRSSPTVRAALFTLSGRLGDDSVLPELCDAVEIEEKEETVRNAAIRALSNWKTEAALPGLLRAAIGPDEQSRRLAQRGAVEVIRRAYGLHDAQRVTHYRKLAPRMKHDEEKRMLLSAVGNLSGVDAFAFAAEFLAEDALRSEAEAALIRIAKRSGKPDAGMVPVLKTLAAEASSDALKKEAQALVKPPAP